MARILLLLPTSTYRARPFLHAALGLGVETVVGCDHRLRLEESLGRAITIDFEHEDRTGRIEALHAERPLDAIVPVDDESVLLAAVASERLGLPHNSVASVRASRNKALFRKALAAAGAPQPAFAEIPPGAEPPPESPVGYPCVVKPVSLSGSRGVIRADDGPSFRAALDRVTGILRRPDVRGKSGPDGGAILVEEMVCGPEISLEGVVLDGRLRVLAFYDKPDPLEGPCFEETIYVTPSRHPREWLEAAAGAAQMAVDALGLTRGPVHAEIRVGASGARVIEMAARTIGGLCSRTLRFDRGASLEDLVVRLALGMPVDRFERDPEAAGVLMLPIPGAGIFREVRGRKEAGRVAGIEGLEMTVAPGDAVEPLPEGGRYLGFLFARGPTPDLVEAALREAHSRIHLVIEPAA